MRRHSAERILFGTDGWRARSDEHFNRESVDLVVQALSDWIHHVRPPGVGVLIGFDGRAGGGAFARRAAGMLAGNGIPVRLSDRITPTPVVSWATKAFEAAAGVMFTASHNPPIYNGIKLKASDGGPFAVEQTRAVENLIGARPPAEPSGDFEQVDLTTPYLDHITSRVDIEAVRTARVPWRIDSMGGAGARILEQILGIRHATIDGEPDADFYGRSPEPIEENLASLLATGADGLATDGDADRLGVVCRGVYMHSHEVMLLLLRHLVEERGSGGTVVKTASGTEKLRAMAARYHLPLREVQVGFKYVADAMRAEAVVFGGEESGGYGVPILHVPDRDGLLSALLLAEAVAMQGKPLYELLASLRKEYGVLDYFRIDRPDARPDRHERVHALSERIPRVVAGFSVGSTDFYRSRHGVNGIKLHLSENRWVLIRSSETEPLVRVYAEGGAPGESRAIVQAALNWVFRKE